MTHTELCALLEQAGETNLFLLPEFPDALVGVMIPIDNSQSRAVYSRAKILEALTKNMPLNEAEDHYEFNIAGSYVGPGTPIFIDRE